MKAKKSSSKVGSGKKLVIVESPAKCRTITKILGSSYEVKATMGHIIDLQKTRMSVDVENGFKPKYVILKARKKTYTELKKASAKSSALYLACDPDREGEAIAWHLMNEFGKKTPAYRVRFNEITSDAITRAFEHTGKIDMNLVGAQQARRILDRIVGYSLSPLLWKKVAKGLSAGRVQTVALRIVVDREKSIRAFKSEEYWSITAELKSMRGPERVTASLEKKDNEPIQIKDKDAAEKALKELQDHKYLVDQVRVTSKRRKPQPPFITSKLQQEAYNRLRFQPTKTMRIAQSLYEGVDLGDGHSVGLITYMRTDSTNISDSAMKEVRQYIPDKIGKVYLSPVPNRYKSKKSSQGAHEAIRPTSVYREPRQLEAILDREQFLLYELIWKKFVACQMKPALFEQSSAIINAGPYMFKASGSRMMFDGFLKLSADDMDKEESKPLPKLQKDEELSLLDLNKEQHFTKPPPRFTDASLVKVLEEEGIGRPSTYAPTIQTIVARHYVERQGGSLVPTELGFVVSQLLVKHFPTILDVKFTSHLESDLDSIEEGKREWVEVLQNFYQSFEQTLKAAQEAMKSVKKVEMKTDEVCGLCGKPMVIKWGRRGRFLSCSAFPECRFSKGIATSVKCPQCQKGHLVARKPRSGRGRKFYGCTEYPACTYIAQRLP